MEELFDLFDRKDLTPQNVETQIQKWSFEDLSDFAATCTRHLPYAQEPSVSVFDFISNSQLSGGISPCSSLACRLEHVESLARFAALYAERIVIQNPFDRYLEVTEFNERMILHLINDIRIIFYLKPLIEAKIISFAINVGHFCKDCYKKHTNEPDEFDIKVDEARLLIEKIYSKDAKFTIRPYNEEYIIEIDAPKELIHSRGLGFKSLPKKLKKFTDITKPYKFTSKDLIETELLSHFSSPIIEDMLLQNWYSRIYNSNYITDRDIDFNILPIINDENVNIQHSVVSKSFSHYVPVLGDVQLSKLVKLREEEGPSFQVYRDAVSNALQLTGNASSKDIRQAFNDIIRPELNNIELTIRNSRRLLWDSLKKEVLFFSGFISIGLYSGLLPPDVSQVVTALGGSAAAFELMKKTTGLVQEPHDIRNNKYYFLWKVKKTLSKGGRYEKKS